jgi:hypothetical protein
VKQAPRAALDETNETKPVAPLLKHTKQIRPPAEIPLLHTLTTVGMSPGLTETADHQALKARQYKETVVATRNFRNENGSRRTGSIGTVATLIGIYAAFYLAVIGVVHFVSSPDAMAAMAPDTPAQQAEAPHVPPEAVGASAGSTAVKRENPPSPSTTDNPRECVRDSAVENECIYN